MSVQYVTAILAQFDTNIAAVSNEVVNPAGGGFKASAYRLTPDKEPDSAIEGLYYLDVTKVDPIERFWGTGENIWTATISVQIGYYRGGGDAGGADGGDRRSVVARANDDCMRLTDVCENPENYNRDVTGIRWIRYAGHRRSHDLKNAEIWQVDFNVEWRSDATTTTSSGTTDMITVASPSDLAGLVTAKTYTAGQQAFLAAGAPGYGGGLYTLQAAVSTAPDSLYVVPTFDDVTLQWVNNSLLGGGTVCFSTPLVNFMNQATTNFLMPTLTGKTFLWGLVRIRIITRDASLSSFSIDQFQNGSSISSPGTQALTVANVNSTPLPAYYLASPPGVKAIDISSNVAQYRQAVAAAGAGLTTCTGYAEAIGSIVT